VFLTAVGICLIFTVSGHAAGSSGAAGTNRPWVVEKSSCRKLFKSVAEKTLCVCVCVCVCEGAALLSVSPSFLFLLHAQPSTEHRAVR